MHSRTRYTIPARQRLLRAAARVFARDGLTGATTRAIALEAKVNEVTLFRQFGTKERLLEAVVRQNFGPDAPTDAPSVDSPAGELRSDLLAHACHYAQLLQHNLPLIRAMIGEIHHHSDHEQQVYRAIFRPLREALITRLQRAMKAGSVRRTVATPILADLFAGMIFTGVLSRASAHIRREYSASDYLEAAVDLLIRGTATSLRP
jgi:AcrR family transcriptional regulator